MNKMISKLTDRQSKFWRIYENFTFAVVGLLLLATCLLVLLEEKLWITLVGALFYAVPVIIFFDILKYKITRDPRDKPIRKWFSFKWAQKYMPDEVLFIHSDKMYDESDFSYKTCQKCGVMHKIPPDTETVNLICGFYGCKGKISPPFESFEAALTEVEKRKEIRDSRRRFLQMPIEILVKDCWQLTERIFKISAWAIIASAVAAAGKQIENKNIEYFGYFLCFLWTVNVFISSFKLTTYIQDEIFVRLYKDEDLARKNQIIAFISSVIIVVLMMIFLKFAIEVFSSIYQNIDSLT